MSGPVKAPSRGEHWASIAAKVCFMAIAGMALFSEPSRAFFSQLLNKAPADCSKPLTAGWSTGKSGKKHAYYLCFAKGCESYRKSIPRGKIESDFEALLQKTSPSSETFQIARAMFAHAWEIRLAQAKEIAATLKSEVVRLDKQIEQLLDRVVDASNASTVSAYERRIAKLEKEKLLVSEKLSQKPGPKRTFDEMFEHAFGFLSSPWKIWQNENAAARKVVFRLAFSERLAYSRNTGFRTPKTTLPFKVLDGLSGDEECMAERVGLFPNYSKSKGFRQHTDGKTRLRYFERYIARYILASRRFLGVN